MKKVSDQPQTRADSELNRRRIPIQSQQQPYDL